MEEQVVHVEIGDFDSEGEGPAVRIEGGGSHLGPFPAGAATWLVAPEGRRFVERRSLQRAGLGTLVRVEFRLTIQDEVRNADG